ncbi:MAG: glycosyltransferase family 39 protein [Lachnospiraceae bacterium]|nr:glycosyltransferase family 39 protein [Lachnospiraceae bacterium]
MRNMNATGLWEKGKKWMITALFAVLLVFSAYIFYGALDTLAYADALESVIQGRWVPVFLLALVLLAAVCLAGLLRLVLPFLERHFGRTVLFLFLLMIVLQVLTVLTVRSSLRQDHLKVFDTAVALLEHGTIADTHFKDYFMKYPNNIPLCLFTYFFVKLYALIGIPKTCWMDLMKIVNIVFMNIGLFCTFRLVCRYRSRRTGLCLLLFLLINPLWYLLTEMYYTSTISLAFSMGALLLFDYAQRQEAGRKKYAAYLLMGIVLAAGYRIRATVILTIAAVLFYAVLRVRSLAWKKGIPAVLTVFLGFMLVFSVYGRLENRYAGFDPDETGYPTVHWIMMSAQGDGQYNSADDAYTGSFETKEERTAADLTLLKERIAQMGPRGLFTLFRNKLRVAFSDGTDDYSALFRTMQETSPLQKYLNAGRGDYLALYLHVYHGLLMGLLLLALAGRLRKGEGNFFDTLAVNFAGACVFYLIWEVDQAYSIPFMLLLLALAADGLAMLSRSADGLVERIPRVRLLPPVALLGLVLAALGVRMVVNQAAQPVKSYAVLQDQETSQDLLLQESFSQSFRTGQAFDHIDLWVANWDGAANDSVYDVEILDEGGNVVAAGEVIGAEAPCMEAYTISFARVEPEREQTYTIRVTLRNPDCAFRTDFLYYQSGAWDMYADGALYAPEEIENVDLAFAVYAVN